MRITNKKGGREPERYANRIAAWRIDKDGLMRVTARVLKEGVYPYGASELPEVSGEAWGADPVMLYVPESSFTPEALATLEGKPVITRSHTWRDVTNTLTDGLTVGMVAGAPRVEEGGGLLCDIVICDRDTIESVKRGDLIEVSAGYEGRFEREPGVFQDREYHGKQTDLRFNHVLLLPEGQGRCGRDVRIINARDGDPANQEKGADGMAEPVEKTKTAPEPESSPAANQDDLEKRTAALEACVATLQSSLNEVLVRLEGMDSPEKLANMVEKTRSQEEAEDAILAANPGSDPAREKQAFANARKGMSLEERRRAVVGRVLNKGFGPDTAFLNAGTRGKPEGAATMSAATMSAETVDSLFRMLALQARKTIENAGSAARVANGAMAGMGRGPAYDNRARIRKALENCNARAMKS